MQKEPFPLPTMQEIISFRQQTTFDATPLLQDYRNQMERWYKQASILNPTDTWRFTDFPCINWQQSNLDDMFMPTVSLPDKVFFGDIRTFVKCYPKIAKRFFCPKNLTWGKNITTILAETCWNKGIVLYVPCNVHVPDIFNLTNTLTFSGSLLIEKVIIILEEGATLNITDQYCLTAKSLQAVFRSIDCYLASNAQLTMLYSHNCKDKYLFSRTNFYLEKQSVLNYAMVTAGAKVNKSWFDIILKGQQAKAFVRGLYLLRDRQHIDITSSQMHQKSNTKSDLVIKGIVFDEANAVYAGNILIEKKGKSNLCFSRK